MKTLFSTKTTRGRAPFYCKWPGCHHIANGTFTDTSSGEAYRVQVCAAHKRQIQNGGGCN
ncbi:MAG: hypothetical protein NT105_23765 [Verrucomicrobia bacterium]|nr:hypothetical protein [Verrucomicrobiota bacterium]